MGGSTQQILKEWFCDLSRTCIFIDGDDTLWHDGQYFRALKSELMRACSLSSSREHEEKINHCLYDNLMRSGLGEKEYARAIKVTALFMGISVEKFQILNGAIERFLFHDIEVLPLAEDALARMCKYNRVLLTKGIKKEQNEKLRRSGLTQHFDEVMVVNRKDNSYFEALVKRRMLSANEVVVVGNSVRHDILPALRIGAAAIWLNHPNNEHGRNEVLPPEACEVGGWAPIVKALEAVQQNEQ